MFSMPMLMFQAWSNLLYRGIEKWGGKEDKKKDEKKKENCSASKMGWVFGSSVSWVQTDSQWYHRASKECIGVNKAEPGPRMMYLPAVADSKKGGIFFCSLFM